VDIFEVPVSYQNHRYLLVVQDYFTKLAEASLPRDQTAACVTEEPARFFSTLGIEFGYKDWGSCTAGAQTCSN